MDLLVGLIGWFVDFCFALLSSHVLLLTRSVKSLIFPLATVNVYLSVVLFYR